MPLFSAALCDLNYHTSDTNRALAGSHHPISSVIQGTNTSLCQNSRTVALRGRW